MVTNNIINNNNHNDNNNNKTIIYTYQRLAQDSLFPNPLVPNSDYFTVTLILPVNHK